MTAEYRHARRRNFPILPFSPGITAPQLHAFCLRVKLLFSSRGSREPQPAWSKAVDGIPPPRLRRRGRAGGGETSIEIRGSRVRKLNLTAARNPADPRTQKSPHLRARHIGWPYCILRTRGLAIRHCLRTASEVAGAAWCCWAHLRSTWIGGRDMLQLQQRPHRVRVAKMLDTAPRRCSIPGHVCEDRSTGLLCALESRSAGHEHAGRSTAARCAST